MVDITLHRKLKITNTNPYYKNRNEFRWSERYPKVTRQLVLVLNTMKYYQLDVQQQTIKPNPFIYENNLSTNAIDTDFNQIVFYMIPYGMLLGRLIKQKIKKIYNKIT